MFLRFSASMKRGGKNRNTGNGLAHAGSMSVSVGAILTRPATFAEHALNSRRVYEPLLRTADVLRFFALLDLCAERGRSVSRASEVRARSFGRSRAERSFVSFNPDFKSGQGNCD